MKFTTFQPLGVYSHRNTAKADAIKARTTTDFIVIYEGNQPSWKHKPGLQENPIPIVLTQFLNLVETHKLAKFYRTRVSVYWKTKTPVCEGITTRKRAGPVNRPGEQTRTSSKTVRLVWPGPEAHPRFLNDAAASPERHTFRLRTSPSGGGGDGGGGGGGGGGGSL